MKKSAVIFILLALILLCSCTKEEPAPNVSVPSSYAFQTSAPAQENPDIQITPTQPVIDNTASAQIFFTNANIWSDFDDVQRYDNSIAATNVKSKNIVVFNYPMQTILSYFAEIAFADEGLGTTGIARKWLKPIYYEIYGSADEVDVAAIRWVAELLNGINGFPGMFRANDNNKANVKYYFGNITYIQAAMGITDNSARSCTRLFADNDTKKIQLAKIGIVSDTTSRKDRNSLILEETLQMLGLNQSTLNYPQSLFYKNNSTPQVPDEMDWAIVKLLYSPEVTAGMDKSSAITAAGTVLVSRYESGVVYTDPVVDFAMLALQNAIQSEIPTETPTDIPELPTTAPTDPTSSTLPTETPTSDTPTSDNSVTQPSGEQPTGEQPTSDIVIIPPKPGESTEPTSDEPPPEASDPTEATDNEESSSEDVPTIPIEPI